MRFRATFYIPRMMTSEFCLLTFEWVDPCFFHKVNFLFEFSTLESFCQEICIFKNISSSRLQCAELIDALTLLPVPADKLEFYHVLYILQVLASQLELCHICIFYQFLQTDYMSVEQEYVDDPLV